MSASRYSLARAGMMWTILEGSIGQIISFAINMFMVTLLSPQNFGIIATVTVLIALGTVLSNSGFGSALIRKKDRDNIDYCVVFYFSLTVAIIYYISLIMFSDIVADSLGEPEITKIVKVLGVILIINAFTIISRVKLNLEMRFKTLAKCNVLAIALSAVVAIIFAKNDFGYWALVAQQVTMALCSSVLVFISSPWIPIFKFDISKFKKLFPYSSRMIATGIIDCLYNNILTFAIAKTYSTSDLGLYNQANKLTNMPIVSITTAIQNVSFPLLVKEDEDQISALYLKMIRFTALLCFPIMFGLSIVSEPLVSILFDEQWQLLSTYIAILSIGMVVHPVQAYAFNILSVFGRSDYILKLELFKKIAMSLLLIVFYQFGVVAVCYIMLFASYLMYFINLFFVRKVTSIPIYHQLFPVMAIWVCNALISTVVYVFYSDVTNDYIRITFSLLVAISLYLVVIRLFFHSYLSRTKNIPNYS